MKENSNYILLLEKSNENLKLSKKDDEYYLEGIAAVFGKENENHRIYEEKEYLPHLEYLKNKIKQKRLLGELDHPKDFDISLKNISHLITDLKYDKDSRTIKIRIKLLDTPSGKIAKSLVDAGIPVSISSRAAGVVREDKTVEIKKIFTYDLVADPGFENAQLERIYESVGYHSLNESRKDSIINNLHNINEDFGLKKNSNIQIYKIKDKNQISKILENVNNIKNMDNNFVTAEELNNYSLLLKKEINSLKEKIKNLQESTNNKKYKNYKNNNDDNYIELKEKIKRLEKYTEYLAENLEASIKYSDYLAENIENIASNNNRFSENLDKIISYTKYLSEHVDNNISYSEYLASNIENNILNNKKLIEELKEMKDYSDYIAENLNNIISYTKYLSEHVNKNISYSNYLAEHLDKNISYSNYLAKHIDKNISYSEYLGENLDKGISYADYLGKKVNEHINYSEYLRDKIQEGIEYSQYIAENVNNNLFKNQKELAKSVNESIKEGKKTSGFGGDYSSLSEKVDMLIESLNKNKKEEILNENKYPFIKLLDENTKEKFISLNETEKQKVSKALNEQNYNSKEDVIRIMTSTLSKEGEKIDIVKQMPEELKPVWESLNDVQKSALLSQSKFYRLETPYQINYFWKTRLGNLVQPSNVEQLNESKNTDEKKKKILVNKLGISKNYLDNVIKELDRKFKK